MQAKGFLLHAPVGETPSQLMTCGPLSLNDPSHSLSKASPFSDGMVSLIIFAALFIFSQTDFFIEGRYKTSSAFDVPISFIWEWDDALQTLLFATPVCGVFHMILPPLGENMWHDSSMGEAGFTFNPSGVSMLISFSEQPFLRR